MRIFAWSADPGTAYWRLTLPLAELAKAGHDVMIDGIMPECVQFAGEADVLVAGRTANPGPSETFQRLCREERMLCVYECDDDFFSIEPHNKVAYDLFSRPDIQKNIKANLAAAHLVTVSTEYLAEVVSQYTSAPISVLPNRVPRWLTELPMPEYDAMPVTIGHTGGLSHVRDFGEMAKPLRSFLQHQSGAAEFVSVGQDNTARVASIRGRTRHVPWQLDVPTYLRGLVGIDVGLAPLRDSHFNRSKSALKVLEFGALGLPVIASDVGPYIGTGSTGVILCSTPSEWRCSLDVLMDPAVRIAGGLGGREWARQHLVEEHAHEWLDAYVSQVGATALAQ